MLARRPLRAAFWLTLLLPATGGWLRHPPGTTEASNGFSESAFVEFTLDGDETSRVLGT